MQNSENNPIHHSEAGIKNFWQWFDGSQFVDEQGRPLVLYHGTTRGKFPEFKTHDNSRSVGFIFTSSKNLALTYSGQDNNAEPGPTSTKAGLYQVYLRAKNIKIIDWKGAHFGDNGGTNSAILEAKDSGYDGVIIRNVNDPGSHVYYLTHRGITPEREDIQGDLFVVFNPTQIKSATGNCGKFDEKNSGILK